VLRARGLGPGPQRAHGPEQKLKDWSGKKDSDIAHAILVDDHKFNAVIENTEIVHEEEVSTILQRETDMHFLRRLALRNGYECYVEGRPRSSGRRKSTRALSLCSRRTSATRPLSCASKPKSTPSRPPKWGCQQIDRVNKEVLDASVESSRETALGQADPQSLLGTGVAAGQVYVGAQGNRRDGNDGLVSGAVHRGQWLVTRMER